MPETVQTIGEQKLSLLLNALNKYRYKHEAAEQLGVSTEWIRRKVAEWGIVFVNGKWVKDE